MSRNYLNLFVMCFCALSLVTVLMVNTSESVYAAEGDVEDDGLTEEEREIERQEKIDALKDGSPLLKAPETPEEYIESVIIMIDLARPELAKVYLDEMLKDSLDDDALLSLRDHHGPGIFLRLARVKKLQPTSTNLLKQINDAFRKSGATPKRIDSLIDKLSGTASEQDIALTALTNAGSIVVPRMLQQYSSTKNNQSRDDILIALTAMGKPAVAPLVATINAPEKEMQAAAVQVLGGIGDRSSLDYLWYPAFSPKGNAEIKRIARKAINRILNIKKEEDSKAPLPSEIANELKRIALVHYQNQYKWITNDQGGDEQVAFWYWDKKQDQPAVKNISSQLASLRTGVIFARQAFQLLPENKELQGLYLGMSLALDATQTKNGTLPAGSGTALNTALIAGEDVVSVTLTQALKYRRSDIAIHALQVLSQIASRSQLSLPLGEKSPIVAAMNYPDSRVQFAAATTVLQLDPQKQFRGSSRVVAILSRALRSEGASTAIVIHPNTQISVSIASLVEQVGFNTTTAQTGSAGFRLAAKRDDIELILVDANVARWGLSQTIANIRADARTAFIPIVVFGPNNLKERILKSFRNVPLLTFIDKPGTLDQLTRQLEPFLAQLKSPTPTPEQRAAKMESAAYWLAHIANGQRTKIFSITSAQEALIDSLNEPRLFSNAMQALSVIGSKEVQQQFQKVAINTDQETATREAAALKLAYHIQHFGILLDSRDISEVKTAWKNSAADANLATAFATIIGSLKPDRTRAGGRLKKIVPAQPVTSTPEQ